MNSDGKSGFIPSLQSYAARPFSPEMDLFHWFLFTGLILIMAGLWAFMIRSITAIE